MLLTKADNLIPEASASHDETRTVGYRDVVFFWGLLCGLFGAAGVSTMGETWV